MGDIKNWMPAAIRRAEQWGFMMEALIDMAVLDMRLHGGPSSFDFDRARGVGLRLAFTGDVAEGRMQGMDWGGTAAENEGMKPPASGEIAKALAIGAWCPGGLNFGSRHWEEK